MMKALNFIAGVASVALLASCGGAGSEKTAETKDENKKEMHADHKGHDGMHKMNLAESVVLWKGTMLGIKSHEGTVPLTEGWVEAKDGKFVDGKFVADLTKITPTDESYSEDAPKSKLVGHLSSADFFDVANHPTATFEITGQKDSLLMGNFTVRGNTHEETAIITSHDMEEHTIEVALTFDRKKYGVAWDHPVKDKVISDDIELTAHLKANMEGEAMAAEKNMEEKEESEY